MVNHWKALHNWHVVCLQEYAQTHFEIQMDEDNSEDCQLTRPQAELYLAVTEILLIQLLPNWTRLESDYPLIIGTRTVQITLV